MSNSRLPPYILQELPDIRESINYPIKDLQRIKYTCFDVSKTLIAFGATSGGIYVFNRTPCEFVQLIPNKDGAITRLSISANEKHIAFANGRGIVTVTECKQSLSGGHSAVVSKDHQGNEVTAMVWSERDMLFSGDDIGKISVMFMQNFIAKTFQSSAQTIMSLDSRICQIDVRSSMLLVSTLTRCYVCDTLQEQYRQIGQKLREGEFGACFVTKELSQNISTTQPEQEFSEFKKYNMVNGDLRFAVGKDLENTLIFCARPSSRLWESTVDGTVKRTHQYKQVLGRLPQKIVSVDSYLNDNLELTDSACIEESKSVNFSRIYSSNGAIFCFRKDDLFFLNIDNVDDTVWYEYKDVKDCKVYHDALYVWLQNGSLIHLRFMKIDKFLLKCFIEEKYSICFEICSRYKEYFISSDISPKLHILAGLRDKIKDVTILNNISEVLKKFEDLKVKVVEQKSGIHVVDNTYIAQVSLEDNDPSKQSDDYKFKSLPPEAMQTLKDLSVSVSGKLSSSKKILKEKWVDFEDKMKQLGDKPIDNNHRELVHKDAVVIAPKNISLEQPIVEHPQMIFSDDIIFKESSQKAIETDSSSTLDIDRVSKSLYQYFRLSLVHKDIDVTNLISVIETNSCDIRQVYDLILKLEQFCISIEAQQESKIVTSTIFLTYLNGASQRETYLTSIVKDDELYKYFVDCCICVNMNTQKLANIGCECGFPLPFSRTNQTPEFSDLIDKFIELQWSTQTIDQCYDICKRMPYLWRKILYLKRNEDMMSILRILLQMLDESILHSFLPQFTLDTWHRTVQLYATLYANMCLNCSKKFEHVSVKDMLSWDDLGALMIKSVGGKNAIQILEKHSNLVDAGTITMKFYHTALVVCLFEKIDSSIVGQLTDALYSAYDFQDARDEICKFLRSNSNGHINNIALPLSVASKSTHWGLNPNYLQNNESNENSQDTIYSLDEIVEHLLIKNKGISDCTLCGLPLQNEFLIKDGGLWVFQCGHTFHGACLGMNKVKLCPTC